MRNLTEERVGLEVQADTEVIGLPSCLFQYVEFCLFNFHSHLLMLEDRRKEIANLVSYMGPLSRCGEDNPGLIQGGQLPVPAAQRYMEIQDLDEEIRVLRKRTEPVIGFIHSLGADLEVSRKQMLFHFHEDHDFDSLEILEKFYFSRRKPRWSEIEELFHYSKRAFSNKRNRLVQIAAQWLCRGMVKGFY